MLGCVDMRSCGYFHISRDTLKSVIKSSFKENCSLLTEEETEQYFDLYNKDHKEVLNFVSKQLRKDYRSKVIQNW